MPVRIPRLLVPPAFGLLAVSAAADEVVVQNDSFVSGGPAVIVGDFIPNEEAGARLTSPCEGAIVAVQIGWLADDPGALPSLEQAIHIYGEGSFPVPGLELETLLAPVMTPGFLNEFRYVDKAQTVPLNVPVQAGDMFYVTLEFANPTDVGGGGASVFRDVDGCQAGKNVLFAAPGFWFDLCQFLAGDLVIRAVVDCGAGVPGACCQPTGICNDGVTESECTAVGGVFQGPDTTCAGGACDGACCLPGGDCTDVTENQCDNDGGTFQGIGTTCAGGACPEETEACCFGTSCLDLTVEECDVAGGSPQGPGTACDPGNVCPIGACCLPDGSCMDGVSLADCDAAAGTYQGNGTSCGEVTCPQPEGACCLSGGCLLLTEADCAIVPDSAWAGPLTSCADGDGNGVADDCDCPADLDGDGIVGTPDFLQLLAGWGPCASCPEDLDGDGTVGTPDFLALLAAWGPC